MFIPFNILATEPLEDSMGSWGGGGVINQVTFAIFKTIFINIVETPWLRKNYQYKNKGKNYVSTRIYFIQNSRVIIIQIKFYFDHRTTILQGTLGSFFYTSRKSFIITFTSSLFLKT